MVSTPALFDTNILIDYLNGVRAARLECDKCSDRAISVVTWMEVMAGANDTDEGEIRQFLSHFATLPITAEVAERAVLIRRSRTMKLPDAMIKATAEESGRVLITRNTRDFPRKTPGVNVPY